MAVLTINQIELLNVFKILVKNIPGFSPFELSDLETYLDNSSCFSLSFKKEKAAGVLYGLEHASIRRRLINCLDIQDRLNLILPKLTEKGFFDSNPLGSVNHSDIVSVSDIGMGHSVYLIESAHHKWVVKEGFEPNQAFFLDVLNCLELPSYDCIHHQFENESFSIFPYLGEENLNTYVQTNALSSTLEKQLAQITALSDFLGRGDRHFENYVLNDEKLFAVDVSFLFWENNEKWLESYLKGGLAEFSYYLSKDLSERDIFFEKFFGEYELTRDLLNSKKELVFDLIQTYFSKQVEPFQLFVSNRLENPSYITEQKNMYLNAMKVYETRLKYKAKLSDLADLNFSKLDQFPYLKMYYLADKGRKTAFFLLERNKRDFLFQLIDDLVKQRASFLPH